MFAGLIEFEQYQPRSSAVKSLSLLQFCPCSTAGLQIVFSASCCDLCLLWRRGRPGYGVYYAGSSHIVQVYCFTPCQKDKNMKQTQLYKKKLQVESTLQIHTSLLITSLSQSRSLWQSASCILLMINNQIITEYYLSKRSIGTLIVTDSFCLIG